MKIEDDILIERFLRKELSELEYKEVLKRLEKDKAFKEYYLFEKELFENLNEQEWSFINSDNTGEVEEYVELYKSLTIQNLQKKIKIASASYIEESNTKKVDVKKLLFSVAAIGLLLLGLFQFFPKKVNYEELYLKETTLSKLPSIVTRGTNDELIEKAITLFKDGKYKEAIPMFTSLLMIEQDQSALYIYKALSYAAINDYDKGQESLALLINSDLIDAEKGYWYKALLFLKANELGKAKHQLQYIIDNSLFKNKEAKKLLEEL